MLHARLPQLLGRLMCGQFEADCRLVLLKLARSDLQVEVVTLVRDLQDLGPRETVDSQSENRKNKLIKFPCPFCNPSPHHSLVPVHQQSRRTHSQHYVNSLRVLGRVQVHAVHGQLLGVLQVVQLGHRGRLSLVRLVQVHHLLLQLGRLIGRKLKLPQVVAVLHLLRIIVAQFGLHEVRAEQGVCDKGAGQPPLQDVVAHLQTQVVARDILLQLRRFRWIEFDGKLQHPRVVFEHLRHLLVQLHPDARIRRSRVQQAEVVLLDDVQTGADCVQQVAALDFALKGEGKGISWGFLYGGRIDQLTSIVTSRTDPSSSVTLATAVLPEDEPDFFDGDSVIVVGGGGAVFVSAGILARCISPFFLVLTN